MPARKTVRMPAARKTLPSVARKRLPNAGKKPSAARKTVPNIPPKDDDILHIELDDGWMSVKDHELLKQFCTYEPFHQMTHVKISGVSKKEMQWFFSAGNQPIPRPSEKLHSLMRLSHKFGCGHLQQRILAALPSFFRSPTQDKLQLVQVAEQCGNAAFLEQAMTLCANASIDEVAALEGSVSLGSQYALTKYVAQVRSRFGGCNMDIEDEDEEEDEEKRSEDHYDGGEMYCSWCDSRQDWQCLGCVEERREKLTYDDAASISINTQKCFMNGH